MGAGAGKSGARRGSEAARILAAAKRTQTTAGGEMRPLPTSPPLLTPMAYNAGVDALLEKARGYLPDDRSELVERALEFANAAHEGQTRRSGEPYVHHPVEVASYLADLNLDAATLAAALLHDVVEDCGVSVDDLRERFGDDVARLADGVTKLTRLDTLTGGAQPLVAKSNSEAESLRKMLVAMANDIRVVLIKLADRLHNMRTLAALPPARRAAIAQETLDIYAPLAHRLGMGEVKWQLEDLAFRYIQPDQYRRISKLLSTKRKAREAYVLRVTERLREELDKAGFAADVTGRPKHIYSIFRKAQSYAAQGKQVGDIFDLFAVRVLVSTVPDCYGALGLVHSLWRPVPGQFDDYIASPKENMYQSLHTTVRSLDGHPVEVQVRTRDMHRVSEYGVASHWSYKEGGASKGSVFEERMTWLRQLLEWQRDVSPTDEFLENVTGDLFRDQVFVYTPKNEVRELPAGATPIDFAYRIHTELGHRCIGAKINGRLAALNTPLQSGDTVEVLTSKIARGPSLDWLNPHLDYVKTSSARQAIRAWFRHQERDANIERGRAVLKKELKRLSTQVDEGEVAKWFRYDAVDDLYAAIGSGLVTIAQVAGRLSAKHAEESAAALPVDVDVPTPVHSGVSVLGVGDLLTRMAECCTPLPGDAIQGYITRTRGVTVHKSDCANIHNGAEPARIVSVDWGQTRSVFPVRIRLECWDRVGLLHDITGATSSERVNIAGSTTEPSEGGVVVIHITVQVASIEQLSRLFTRIEGVRGVRNVSRELPKPRAKTPAKAAAR